MKLCVDVAKKSLQLIEDFITDGFVFVSSDVS